MATPSHRPVLLAQALDALCVRPAGLFVDATVGLGGHAAALLERLPASRVLGFDLDAHALAIAHQRLAVFGERVRLVERSYRTLATTLAELGFQAVDGVLFDLGLSSLQLDTPERGFSFRHDAALDMRFGSSGATAAELVAQADEGELMRILWDYGEEPRARAIARAIVRARERGPITTTSELRALVLSVIRYAGGRIDPATRTFQALRIATNRELEAVTDGLTQAARLLAPGGRLVAIAFHSLEDRQVKQTFRRLAGRCTCPPGSFACQCEPEQLLEILTARPVTPDEPEIRANPRARSARLRVAARRPS
jgi:16S rRNA (cytosine1402-N4)-methyltransferase